MSSNVYEVSRSCSTRGVDSPWFARGLRGRLPESFRCLLLDYYARGKSPFVKKDIEITEKFQRPFIKAVSRKDQSTSITSRPFVFSLQNLRDISELRSISIYASRVSDSVLQGFRSIAPSLSQSSHYARGQPLQTERKIANRTDMLDSFAFSVAPFTIRYHVTWLWLINCYALSNT